MPLGTIWELEEPHGNMKKTCWEHIGNMEDKQKNFPHPTPKGKNKAHHELLIGCMKLLFPKLFVTIFGLC